MRFRRLKMFLRISSVVLLVCAPQASCTSPMSTESRTVLRIATFEAGGIYHLLGTALAGIYSSRVPGVSASAHSTAGSVFNVHGIQEGNFDVAFTLGNVAYLAYQRGIDSDRQPHRRLRGIAVLYEGVMQIISRADSGIRRVEDLRGHRIGVGTIGSGTELAARIVIGAYGLSESDLTAEPLSTDQVLAGMRDHTVDAGFVVASYPYPAISDADTSVGVRLIPIERHVVSRIRADYPFFRPTVIPVDTYHQPGEVETMGVDNLLVCRSDLGEELVYRLTKELFGALPELRRLHTAAAQIDPDKASATPLPLHPGAARYYREREILQ